MLRKDVPGELARSKYEFAKALLTPRAGRIDVKNVEDIPDSCTDEFFARVENAYEELTGAG